VYQEYTIPGREVVLMKMYSGQALPEKEKIKLKK